MVDVFISYARQERERAERVKSKLDVLKLDLFFDIVAIDGGAEFPAVITRALDGSKAIVACCSPLYFTRSWCLSEAQEGTTRGIVVPVILERFERTAPPVNMRSLNFLDLTDWSGEDEHEDWNRTLLSLGKLVGRELSRPLRTELFDRLKPGVLTSSAPVPSTAQQETIADLRHTWRNFPDRENDAAVERFRRQVHAAAPGSGLEFEVEHHSDELRRQNSQRERDFATLGLPSESTMAQLKVAYRQLAKKLHPDVGHNWEKPEIAERLTAVTEAYFRLTRS